MSISRVMEVIQQVRQQLNDYPMSDYLYNEATTRNVVINPMIKALGWDLHNLDQCSYEINPKINAKGELSGKKPADYVLGARSGRSVVVIEAKRMDYGLKADRGQEQLSAYAEELFSGVAVLTNGIDWYIYNLRKGGSFSDKLDGEVDLLKCNLREGAQILHQSLDVKRWW